MARGMDKKSYCGTVSRQCRTYSRKRTTLPTTVRNDDLCLRLQAIGRMKEESANNEDRNAIVNGQ